jgi:hypothetical protein
MTTTETPISLRDYLKAGTAHAACDHPMTKAGRAQCRRDKVKATTETIVNHTFVFVRQARAEGHVNLIHRITLDEVAQEHGYSPRDWNPTLAVRLVKENARLMDETNLLADDMR